MKAYLFTFQMMYKSQFVKKKFDPYDWFCGLGSHIEIYITPETCKKEHNRYVSFNVIQM